MTRRYSAPQLFAERGPVSDGTREDDDPAEEGGARELARGLRYFPRSGA